MANHNLKKLLIRYTNKQITEEELLALLDLMRTTDPEELDYEIDQLIENYGELEVQPEHFEVEEGLARLKESLSVVSVSNVEDRDKGFKSNIKWIGAVAASVLLIGFASFFGIRAWKVDQTDAKQVNREDIILADMNQPRLSLADGRIFDLSKIDQKTMHIEGISVITDADGKLVYNLNELAGKIETKTFINPKGATAQLILADGTKVWLNSGTEIQYPSRFELDARKVTIKGEAYFEVAPENSRPFIVQAGAAAVRVLGTHFNVKALAYSSETYTTLLEGSVQVSNANGNLLLQPGEQAVAHTTGKLIKRPANFDADLAWKAGYFWFDDTDIQDVMKQITAWYNIKSYQIKQVTPDLFSGSLKRTKKLSELLSQLEEISTYKFTIEDGEVLVMKK